MARNFVYSAIITAIVMSCSGCAGLREFMAAWPEPDETHYDNKGQLIGKTFYRLPEKPLDTKQ